MNHLGLFFEKFTRLASPHKETRAVCANLCAEILGKPFSSTNVRVSGRILYLDLSPTEKGEIMMEKSGVLKKINSSLLPGRSSFVDIR